MVRSMTGYGRFQETVGGLNIQVEIKSVNHRYFEYGSRLPRAYNFLDDKLKSFVQSRVSRGKVDVTVYIEAAGDATATVTVDHAYAKAMYEALCDLRDSFGLKDDISTMALARMPDVMKTKPAALDEDAVWEAVKTVAEKALDQFVNMREIEGEKMKADVLSRADFILEKVAVIEERNPQTVKEHMEKVEKRMRELLSTATVDESRLLTEAALFADKIAVAEETVRLRSHIDQLHKLLDSEEAVGRKLDFLVQEMNREANTTGSKAQDLELARVVVDIKAELEKIREQIQNIE